MVIFRKNCACIYDIEINKKRAHLNFPNGSILHS